MGVALIPLVMFPMYVFAWFVWCLNVSTQCDQPLESWLGVYLLYTIWVIASYAHCPCGPIDCHRTRLDKMRLAFPVIWILIGEVLLGRSETCRITSTDFYCFVQRFSFACMLLHGVHLSWLTLRLLRTRMLSRVARSRRLRDLLLRMGGHLRNADAVVAQHVIDELELVAYGREIFADAAAEDESRPSSECCICYDTYDEVRKIRRTPCGHLMHHDCLIVWLQFGGTSCPVCRGSLRALARVNVGI